MKIRRNLLSASLAIGIVAIAMGGVASAQGAHGGMSSGMTQKDRPSAIMSPRMMQDGMGQDTMGPGMGSGMMRGGMGMMCPMMAGMMQGRVSETAQGGMGALFGSRVTQMMNLSVEDVRSYLALQLDRLNNKRLKIGNVNADGATISAEIVTVDNSLVQRLKVDRHTGAIEYEN
jgi:hypothetical protein